MIGYLKLRGTRVTPVVKVNGQLEPLPPDTMIRCCDGETSRMLSARQIERELSIPGGEVALWLRERIMPIMIQEDRIINA